MTRRRSYAEYEEYRAKGVQVAREVSAIMRKAGIPKAGRYKPFGGYEPPGFSGSECGNGTKAVPTAVCMWCGSGWRGKIDAMRAAVEADGRFSVVDFRADDEHSGGAFRVTRKPRAE